jgi:hypothetical protein
MQLCGSRTWLSVPSSFAAAFTLHDLRVARVSVSEPAYEDVLSVRSSAYGFPARQTIAAIDAYSELYCAYVGGRPVASITATRAACGTLDCEQYYPADFVAHFRSKLSSTARYCRIADQTVAPAVLQLMIGIALRDQVELGARVFIGNCQPEYLNYYLRLGYQLIAGYAFTHPRWNTRSLVLVASDLHKFRGLAPANADLADPVTQGELAAQVNLCALNGKRFPRHATCVCTFNSERPCEFVAWNPAAEAAAE